MTLQPKEIGNHTTENKLDDDVDIPWSVEQSDREGRSKIRSGWITKQLIRKVFVAAVLPGVRCRKVFRLRIREIMLKHTPAMAESTQDGLNDMNDMIDMFITIRTNMESIRCTASIKNE